MQKLLNDIWSILKAAGDWYIILIRGPNGILFDIQSIVAIIISGITVLVSLCGLIWKVLRRM